MTKVRNTFCFGRSTSSNIVAVAHGKDKADGKVEETSVRAQEWKEEAALSLQSRESVVMDEKEDAGDAGNSKAREKRSVAEDSPPGGDEDARASVVSKVSSGNVDSEEQERIQRRRQMVRVSAKEYDASFRFRFASPFSLLLMPFYFVFRTRSTVAANACVKRSKSKCSGNSVRSIRPRIWICFTRTSVWSSCWSRGSKSLSNTKNSTDRTTLFNNLKRSSIRCPYKISNSYSCNGSHLRQCRRWLHLHRSNKILELPSNSCSSYNNYCHWHWHRVCL